MAIKGSLKEASLPDVLQLLALGKKTGCLSLTDRQNLGSIFLIRVASVTPRSSIAAIGSATCWSIVVR